MRRLCLLLLLTLMISAGVSAQAEDNAWPIVQRCFGDATPPPQGWAFDGTLLMTGHYGLHGFHQGWDTPQVLVFSRRIFLTAASSRPMVAGMRRLKALVRMFKSLHRGTQKLSTFTAL